VLVAPLAAHLWPQEGSAGALVRLRDWRWLLLPAGLAVGFALSSPYVVLDWPTASGMIAFLGSQVQAGEGLALAAEPNGWLFHLKGVVIACGLPALLLACAGAVMAIRQRRRDVLPLLVFGMVWVVVIATSGLRYQRYELPLLPVAAVLAALAVEELLRHRQARARRLAAAAAVLAAGVALWASTAYVTCNFAGLAGRSRDVMLQELVARVPESATVGVVARPWFSIAPVNYQNGGAIMGRFPVWQQYEAQLRPVIVTGADRVWLQQRRPDYFLLSEFDIRDGLRRGCDPATVRFMEALEADYALVYETPARLCKACWPAFDFVPHDWLYPAPWQRLYARKGER